METASSGNLSLVQVLLKTEMYINMKADDGSTALHCAAKTDQVEMIALLLSEGAMLEVHNNLNRTPLFESILANSNLASKTLLQQGAKVSGNMLQELLKNSQHTLFEYVLCQKSTTFCDDEIKLVFATAAELNLQWSLCMQSSLPQVESHWIYENGEGARKLAVKHDHATFLESLLVSGILSPDFFLKKMEMTLFQLAVYKGNARIVKVLLACETTNSNTCTWTGLAYRRLLYIAAMNGKLNIVAILLQHSGFYEDRSGRPSTENYATYSGIAAYPGSVDLLKSLLAQMDYRGWQPLQIVKFESHPLSIAVSRGHFELVKLLLSRHDLDCNIVNSKNETLPGIAARRGHEEVLKLLLRSEKTDHSHKQNSRRALLIKSASRMQWQTVKQLLDLEEEEATCGLRKRFAAVERRSEKEIDIAIRMFSDKDVPGKLIPQLLLNAAKYGNLEIMTLLLERYQVDVNVMNRSGNTALHIAARGNQYHVVTALLDHYNGPLEIVNREGETALQIAVYHDHDKILRALLDYDNGCVNLLDKNGDTALHHATRRFSSKCLGGLLNQKEIRVNCLGRHGITALCEAVDRNNFEALKALLLHKEIEVNICTTESQPRTALDFATRSWRPSHDIRDLLLAHGATSARLTEDSHTQTILATQDISIQARNARSQTTYDGNRRDEMTEDVISTTDDEMMIDPDAMMGPDDTLPCEEWVEIPKHGG